MDIHVYPAHRFHNEPADQFAGSRGARRARAAHAAERFESLGQSKNLFEIPVLFYALALYLFVTRQVDAVDLDAAWIFVAFRVAHSAIHCTINIVIVRFYIYALSTLALWFMLLRAALQYFSA